MILVSGGTGRLGTLVVRDLLAAGERVRVLTRSADRAGHLVPLGAEVALGDLRDDASVRAAVRGAATVLAAAHGFSGPRGTTPATVDRDGNAILIRAAHAEDAAVVLVSVVGAAANSPFELFRAKHAAEQTLRASGVPGAVVRATAFAELWIEILRRSAVHGGRPVVFGRGQNPVNFVSVGDVAALVTRVVGILPERGQLVLEIGGPDNLTLAEFAARVQRADKRDGAPRHVPRGVLHLLAQTVGRIAPQVGRQVRAGLAMDTADLTLDSSSARALFLDLPCTSIDELLAAGAPIG